MKKYYIDQIKMNRPKVFSDIQLVCFSFTIIMIYMIHIKENKTKKKKLSDNSGNGINMMIYV